MIVPGAEDWKEKVVFLETKAEEKSVPMLNVPLPIRASRLQQSVTTGEAEIPPAWFLEGMVIVLAADPFFPHATSYKEWLHSDLKWVIAEMQRYWNESDPVAACFAAVILQENPEDPLALSILASAWVDNPNAHEEISKLCHRVAKNPKAGEDALWICALVSREAKLPALAVQCLERIRFSRKDEREQAVREMLRSVRNEWRMEQAEKALQRQSYEEVISLLGDLPKPDQTPYAWFLVGQAQQGLGLFGASVSSLQKSIESGYQTAEAYNDLAIAHYLEGDSDRALQVSEDGLLKFPDEARLLYNRLIFALQLDRVEQAQDSLRRLRTAEITDPELRRSVSELLENSEE